MKVGDLVRFKWGTTKESGTLTRGDERCVYGVVISIPYDHLVEILWTGRDYTYMESVTNLEVMS